MSLISLLIALYAERKLSSKVWQFKTYYYKYKALLAQFDIQVQANHGWMQLLFFISLPTVLVHYLFTLIDSNLFEFLLSTLLLIPCFGCVNIRESYKNFVLASLRGDQESCQLEKSRLQNAHALGDESFGLTLVWLNYTYYAAVMIFFIVFGAAGALFYRLLVTVNETYYQDFGEQVPASAVSNLDKLAQKNEDIESDNDVLVEENVAHSAILYSERLLAIIDWLLVRVVSVGYLLVGHFSNGVTYWLKNLFDFEGGKKHDDVRCMISEPREFLTQVALNAQDNQIDDLECTTATCAQVRLVKRNLLLMLAVTALLTLTGYIA